MVPFGVSDFERHLGEDVAGGDLTTEALAIGRRSGRMTFAARGAATVAGIEIAAGMIERCGAAVEVHRVTGERVAAGTLLLTAEGTAAALHASWKTSQTLVEYLSGIATAARAVVDTVKAANPAVRVACTRKTFPGGRRLCHLAVHAGGAILHRAGLSETILVFAEHRAFLGGETLTATARRLRMAAPEKALGIEVHTVAEAREAIAAGFDVIQLEKMSTERVREVANAARTAARPPLIAAAGGISVANAADYVAAGAGLIVTSWPYTACPADVQVRIECAPGER